MALRRIKTVAHKDRLHDDRALRDALHAAVGSKGCSPMVAVQRVAQRLGALSLGDERALGRLARTSAKLRVIEPWGRKGRKWARRTPREALAYNAALKAVDAAAEKLLALVEEGGGTCRPIDRGGHYAITLYGEAVRVMFVAGVRDGLATEGPGSIVLKFAARKGSLYVPLPAVEDVPQIIKAHARLREAVDATGARWINI